MHPPPLPSPPLPPIFLSKIELSDTLSDVIEDDKEIVGMFKVLELDGPLEMNGEELRCRHGLNTFIHFAAQ
jgi:hypothetical protein